MDFSIHYRGKTFEEFVNALQQNNISSNFDMNNLVQEIKKNPNKDLIRKMASSPPFLLSSQLDQLISHLVRLSDSESILITILDAIKRIKERVMYLNYDTIAIYFFPYEVYNEVVDFFVEEININFGVTNDNDDENDTTLRPYPRDPLNLLFLNGKRNNYAYARKILPRLNDPKKFLEASEYKDKYLPLYNEIMNESVLDTTIGLRSLNLPSLVVQNIASHAYDTTGLDTYNLIATINEHRNPNIVGAATTTYDEQEYIDL